MKTAQSTDLFFQQLHRFGDAAAIIVASTKETLSYADLAARVTERSKELKGERKLVFVEAANDIESIVDYLACLISQHVIFLVENLSSPKTQALIDLYQPNLLIDTSREIRRHSEDRLDLHPDCALLLSTSGSTGSPKFVKLSLENLQANAASIADYLSLTEKDRALQHLKPFYSYGLSIINSHLYAGASLVLSDKAVIEVEFWAAFDANQATSFAGVPYTFETLKRSGFEAQRHPSLRYATQAGGKLDDTIVREFAEHFGQSGRDFFVMYGQTEAAPRMSYLPPALAASNPGSIGKAIPNGRLYLVDEAGNEIKDCHVCGELAYEGANVMLGYATCRAELATAERPGRLLTGDLAHKNEQGLYFITGRKSRFVKPFGVRVNLDEIQTDIRRNAGCVCAVTGNDDVIIIALESTVSNTTRPDIQALAKRLGLPDHIFKFHRYDKLPLLPNEKYDFRRILAEATTPSVVTSQGFLPRVIDSIWDILGLKQPQFQSVAEIYNHALPNVNMGSETRFADLGVDSLAYVGIAIEMETLFRGEPPRGWHEMTLGEIEALYHQANADQTYA